MAASPKTARKAKTSKTKTSKPKTSKKPKVKASKAKAPKTTPKRATTKPAGPKGRGPLEAGSRAPAFTLPRDGGGTISLSGFKGRKLVLYFYPKAGTSGCTLEAHDFSRLAKAFDKAGTSILGVSADPVKKLDSFRDKQDLAIPLASDETTKMLTTYGVWTEKSLYGRKFMGVERTTFLIGPDGTILRVWPKVKVAGHAADVLKAVQDI